MRLSNSEDPVEYYSSDIKSQKNEVNILLVLSDQEIISSLSQAISGLNSLSPNVTVRNDYRSAITSIAKDNFDICIVGPNLVGKKCPEFISKLKSKDPTTSIIVIVGDTPTAVDIESIHAGAVDYLMRSSINSHQLEWSLRYGMNRRKRERKLFWVAEAQRIIKETALDLAVTGSSQQSSILDNCLERAADLFESNAIILIRSGKIKSLWASDAKLMASLQCDPQTNENLEKAWASLLSSLTAKLSICNKSDPTLDIELNKISTWSKIQNQGTWCASAAGSHSQSCSILVIFSSKPFTNSDPDVIRTISDLCNLFGSNLVRVDSELALRESKRQYKNLVENLGEGIMLCDMSETIVQVNSRLGELLKRSPESLLGKKSYEVLVPEAERDEILSRIKRRHQGISEKYEIEFIRSDMSRSWCEIRASPVYDENGELVGTMGAISDISSRIAAVKQSVQLQRELIQSQKLEAVSEIAAGISSEINHGLEAISEHLHSLNLPNQKPEQRKTAAMSALGEIESAKLILKKLKELSRSSLGSPMVASPSSLVSESIKFMQSFVGPNTELCHESAHDDLAIEIDPLHFRQILLSTILATTSATRAGGKVFIRHSRRSIEKGDLELPSNTTLAHNYAVIVIEDYCSYLSAKQLRRLLLPRLGEGNVVRDTSIELASLSHLMLSAGGLVDISAIPEDKHSSKIIDGELKRDMGIRVELSFPVFKSEQNMNSETFETNNDQSDLFIDNANSDKVEEDTNKVKLLDLKAGKVLVVDDEEMLVQLMQRFLEMSGIESYGFSDPADALNWYKENNLEVSLVILDLKMSGMDGRECFARMLEINPNVRVGFLSGFIEKEVEQGLLRQGALRFFQKPLRYPELVNWVKFALHPND